MKIGDRVVVTAVGSKFIGCEGRIVDLVPLLDGAMIVIPSDARPMFFGRGSLRIEGAK